jgi:TIR domain
MTSLPTNCFVSHSYRDTENKRLLLSALPSDIAPVFFPPITVTPDQMVTSTLIPSILGCDGLIYINGGLSAQSFWVAFEQDFAKRSRIPVFQFDPITSTIRRDESPPLHLSAFPSYSHRDRARVDQVLACMRDERFFDLFSESDLRAGSRLEEELKTAIFSRLRAGGYVVVFLSAAAASSLWVQMDQDRRTRIRGPSDRRLGGPSTDAAAGASDPSNPMARAISEGRREPPKLE